MVGGHCFIKGCPLVFELKAVDGAGGVSDYSGTFIDYDISGTLKYLETITATETVQLSVTSLDGFSKSTNSFKVKTCGTSLTITEGALTASQNIGPYQYTTEASTKYDTDVSKLLATYKGVDSN